MRNKNIWILIGLAVLIALAGVLAAVLPTRMAAPQADAPALSPAVTATPEATATQEPAAAPEATATQQPAAAPEATATQQPAAAPTATAAAEATATPEAAATEQPQVTPIVAASQTKAYLLVTVGGVVYRPLPLTEEGEYTLTQENGAQNVIHVTADSVNMQSSTCDNQDCVMQGTVSLENMEDRLLGNMIVCLPNQVTLELYTAEEMTRLLSGE